MANTNSNNSPTKLNKPRTMKTAESFSHEKRESLPSSATKQSLVKATFQLGHSLVSFPRSLPCFSGLSQVQLCLILAVLLLILWFPFLLVLPVLLWSLACICLVAMLSDGYAAFRKEFEASSLEYMNLKASNFFDGLEVCGSLLKAQVQKISPTSINSLTNYANSFSAIVSPLLANLSVGIIALLECSTQALINANSFITKKSAGCFTCRSNIEKKE